MANWLLDFPDRETFRILYLAQYAPCVNTFQQSYTPFMAATQPITIMYSPNFELSAFKFTPLLAQHLYILVAATLTMYILF